MKDIVQQKVSQLMGGKFNTRGLKQRGIADLIEDQAKEMILSLDEQGFITEEATSVRAIEDVQIKDKNQLYKVDVKSHFLDADFSMPNLVSVDRIRRFYEDENNHILYVFIDYSTDNETTTIENVIVCFIEELDWDILAIQNLGKGQLQIKNMKNGLSFTDIGREAWIETLKVKVKLFYENQLEKISKYIKEWN